MLLTLALLLAQDPVHNPAASVTASAEAAGEAWTLKAAWTGFVKPVTLYEWQLLKKVDGELVPESAPLNAGTSTSAVRAVALAPRAQYYVKVVARFATGAPEFTSGPVTREGTVLVPPPKADEAEAKAAVVAALENPATRNRVLKAALDTASAWPLLKGLELEPKTLQVNGGDPVLGLGYAYDKHLHLLESDDEVRGLDLSFRSEGTVAFDAEANPEDFLSSTLSLDFFLSHGGVAGTNTLEEARGLQGAIEAAARKKVSKAELHRSKEWGTFMRGIQEKLSTQVYVEVQAQATIESNQAFSEKQAAFEAQIGLDLKMWNPESTEAQLNLFDWPFSFVRVLTGYDERPRVRGASFPTFMAAFGYVNPHDEDARARAGDDDAYARIRLEASFRTPVARVSESTVFFNANLRVFHEFDARSGVEGADLDRFHYFQCDVASEAGVYVSYASGRLPFDEEDDQVYEIGWRFKL